MKKHLPVVIVLILLFTSCTTLNVQNQASTEKWSQASPLYSMIYNEENGTYSSDYSNVLFIEKTDDDFVILSLADIQIANSKLGDNGKQIQVFKNTADLLVEKTQPDMIAVLGDFGDYLNTDKSLMKIGGIIDSYDIPWAPIFGNHDNAGASVVTKAKDLESFSNSLFKTGPSNLATIDLLYRHTDFPALGNYVVNIVENGELVYSLIFMNTGNYSVVENTKADKRALLSFGSLSETQIQWYRWAVESAKAYNPEVKSALFVHIPIFAYRDAAFAASKDDKQNLDYYKNITYEESFSPEVWAEGYEDSFGVFHDSDICCSNYDDHVFEAIEELGSTNLVICGHDHENNAVIKYHDVILAYSMKTGIGGYGNGELTGGTKITVGKDSVKVEHILVDY